MKNIKKLEQLKALAKLKAEWHRRNLVKKIEEATYDNELLLIIDNSVSMISAAKNIYQTLQESENWQHPTNIEKP